MSSFTFCVHSGDTEGTHVTYMNTNIIAFLGNKKKLHDHVLHRDLFVYADFTKYNKSFVSATNQMSPLHNSQIM